MQPNQAVISPRSEYGRALEILDAACATPIADQAGSQIFSLLHRHTIEITGDGDHSLPRAVEQTAQLLSDIRHDPSRHFLLDLDSRYRWIHLEIEHARAENRSSLRSSEIPVPEQLLTYRNLFRENSSGGVYAWELRNHVHQSEIYEARRATGLLTMAAVCRGFERKAEEFLREPERELNPYQRRFLLNMTYTLRFDCTSNLIVGLERACDEHWTRAVRVLTHGIVAAIEKPGALGRDILLVTRNRCRAIERDIAYSVLSPELAEDARILRYTQKFSPPKEFWQQSFQIQQICVEQWRLGGGKGIGFPEPFTPQQLESVFLQPGGECIALEWKGKLAGIGVQITEERGFFQRHKERVAILERQGSLFPRPRAWNYLVVVNKRAHIGMRHACKNPHGIMVRSCAQSCLAAGCDETLGAVDIENAALQSHLREGCRLVADTEFTTPANRSVKVIQLDLVRSPLEDLILPRH